jgi:hypothetical protein
MCVGVRSGCEVGSCGHAPVPWPRDILVWLPCADTNHSLIDKESGTMLEGYENVCAPRGIEQTDILLMEAINSLHVEEADCSCECLRRLRFDFVPLSAAVMVGDAHL